MFQFDSLMRLFFFPLIESSSLDKLLNDRRCYTIHLQAKCPGLLQRQAVVGQMRRFSEERAAGG